MKAVQDVAFFDMVKVALDASDIFDESCATKKHLVMSKFYYAGGNVRLMFQLPTSKVIEELETAMASSTLEIGQEPTPSVFLLRKMGQQYQKEFISQYVATMLSVRSKDDARHITTFAQSLSPSLITPVTFGCLFEAIFFARLQLGCRRLYDGDEILTLPRAAIRVFNTNESSFPAIEGEDSVWIKPEQFNQGSYDAVFVNIQENSVLFIQVTRAKDHDFRIEFFGKFVSALLKNRTLTGYPKAEIYFVVEKSKAANFSITSVTGKGHLLMCCWVNGTERGRVRIVGMDDITKEAESTA